MALTEAHRKTPNPDVLRQALFGNEFNSASAARPVRACDRCSGPGPGR